ncbi:MAG: HEAT repeat domain-containing protein [Candidatus Acidiferrales bacterium]
MAWLSNFVERLAPAHYVFDALVITAVFIALLVGFILVRRMMRRRYLESRDRRTLAIRRQWYAVVGGEYYPEQWRFNPVDRDIVESILTDRLDVCEPKEAEQLIDLLRNTGLLDVRAYEARTSRGWKRRQALVSLGRMRAPEAIPVLAEALEDSDAETRIAAVRGLGRTGLPQAAEPMLERMRFGALQVPERPLLNALLQCCGSDPDVLAPYLRFADDNVRRLLARVLGEIATPELEEDLLLLASDPLAEVRASSARALARARPRLALTALANLAGDDEWFVRLRAVVALGVLENPRTVPVLIETLCDPNRFVRLRSAGALARLEEHLEVVVQQVLQTRDRYALQAFVSELERTGTLPRLVEALTDPARRNFAESALLGAIRAGTQRHLLDTMARHPRPGVRKAVARLLAQSREPKLLPAVERTAATAGSRREQRMARWLLARLRQELPAAVEQKSLGSGAVTSSVVQERGAA